VKVQAFDRLTGLNPDRYMEKTHFRGTGCATPDAVGDKLCRSYFLAMEARLKEKYEDFCRKAWEDFGPGGKVPGGERPGLRAEHAHELAKKAALSLTLY
jgi:hypothetical protein